MYIQSMCLWVQVEEERKEIVHHANNNNSQNKPAGHSHDHHGGGQQEYKFTWHTIFEDEAFTDFYLADGAVKIFINGSNRGSCRISAQDETRNVRRVSAAFSGLTVPAGIQAVMSARHGAAATWHPHSSRTGIPVVCMHVSCIRLIIVTPFSPSHTGNFRYHQQSFDVGELVAALGVVTAVSSMGMMIKQLMPIRGDALSDDFFKTNAWSEWQISAWQGTQDLAKRGSHLFFLIATVLSSVFVDLVKTSPAVLLSDASEDTQHVTVTPPQLVPYQPQPSFAPAPYPPPPQPQAAYQQSPMQPQYYQQPAYQPAPAAPPPAYAAAPPPYAPPQAAQGYYVALPPQSQ